MNNKVPMKDGYGKALLGLCEKKENIMVLDADVAKSTRTVWVRDKYPEYFMDMGISEQDMVGTVWHCRVLRPLCLPIVFS